MIFFKILIAQIETEQCVDQAIMHWNEVPDQQQTKFHHAVHEYIFSTV